MVASRPHRRVLPSCESLYISTGWHVHVPVGLMIYVSSKKWAPLPVGKSDPPPVYHTAAYAWRPSSERHVTKCNKNIWQSTGLRGHHDGAAGGDSHPWEFSGGRIEVGGWEGSAWWGEMAAATRTTVQDTATGYLPPPSSDTPQDYMYLSVICAPRLESGYGG